MAASKMGNLAIAAVLVLAFASAASAQSTKVTLQDPRNAGSCLNQYNSIINTYYSSDPSCASLITTALNTTVISQCPPTDPGSPVHYCMNKGGNQTLLNAWTQLVSGCELMYVANRNGAGESESGFTYDDNSCFPIFNSFGDFQSWLNDASKYTPPSPPARPPPPCLQPYCGAASLRMTIATVLVALVLAAVTMW